ncbi:MAG: short-chain dehydrogenase/reductase [Marinilabiliales bacterium]|nr:MAG: short-chain dehydrogenase/reductase [Marinilabiliales bacterium]
MNKIALITGASSGIGESAALLLKNEGYIVYGAARRTDKMIHLKEHGINILPLDITDDESIQKCVKTIVDKEGRIDILVNNAGYGSYGAVEDVPLEEAKRQFEVNIFGLARITQLILPKMRENNFGRIINISSMGGKVYTPFGAWYHATKHALEGWSDSLRLEVKPFGIDVVVIEPGGIKTPWGSIAADNLRKTSGTGPYAERAMKAADGTEKMYTSNRLSHPDVIGKVILKAAKTKRPKTRYAKGMGAKISIFIRKWFGDRIFDRVITNMM